MNDRMKLIYERYYKITNETSNLILHGRKDIDFLLARIKTLESGIEQLLELELEDHVSDSLRDLMEYDYTR